jgi:hypothetical protein
MLGKILGAVVGAKVAEQTESVGGLGGALLGAASLTLVRRLSFPALIVLAGGGYAVKKLSDRARANRAKRKSFETPPKKKAARAAA